MRQVGVVPLCWPGQAFGQAPEVEGKVGVGALVADEPASAVLGKDFVQNLGHAVGFALEAIDDGLDLVWVIHQEPAHSSVNIVPAGPIMGLQALPHSLAVGRCMTGDFKVEELAG